MPGPIIEVPHERRGCETLQTSKMITTELTLNEHGGVPGKLTGGGAPRKVILGGIKSMKQTEIGPGRPCMGWS